MFFANPTMVFGPNKEEVKLVLRIEEVIQDDGFFLIEHHPMWDFLLVITEKTFAIVFHFAHRVVRVSPECKD